MDAYDVAGWEAFALAMLGAAAVLVGLIFVALSVNMQEVLRYPWLVGRAGEAVLQLVAVLIACALLLVPGQGIEILGLELAAVGVVSVLIVSSQTLRRRGEIAAEYRRQADTQAVLGILALGLFLPAGMSLMLGAGGGLYWLVPATLACVGLALINSWVLLVEINR